MFHPREVRFWLVFVGRQDGKLVYQLRGEYRCWSLTEVLHCEPSDSVELTRLQAAGMKAIRDKLFFAELAGDI